MKRVYTFGDGKAEGNAEMRNLLGGKGANLAEMNLLGMPVPPGFTITTEVCTEYTQYGKDEVVKRIKADVEKAIAHVESLTGKKFDDPSNPLLVSVRSGARASMPGMMDTVLNLGMNDATVESLAQKSGNPRFAWDSYRRFVQMYGDVVLGMKPKSKADIDPFEEIMDKVKEEKGIKLDTELNVDDLKKLVKLFKGAVKDFTGKDFPDSAWEQLWGGICAVFDSWMNERAIIYRRMNQIPEEWGTAVNVQAMVYGNMGNNSATGVAFSRDAATGENIFNGEYLINAQGEDVVAGIRTPQQITIEGSRRWAALQGISEEERASKYPSLEESMPVCAQELFAIAARLEDYYKDMQDMEFTIQDGKLWMLQTRNGKRTGAAMVKIAMDLLRAGDIDEKTALMRMEPQKLDELLHPVFDKSALKRAVVVAKGLPASPGAAAGQIVFSADEAEAWAEKKRKVVLVRIETSPEDLRGMAVAQGILTMRGGMTSHAAVVARGIDVHPEIMIPLVGSLKEIQHQANVINETAAKVFDEQGQSIPYLVGTMIEVPRAALTANEIATVADFFSFGTNDLTQMTFGFSRDDAPKFLKFYKEHGIIKTDPFEVLDQEGVGQLVRMGVEKGRSVKPELKVGICGEHGGEPSSVKFCAKLGMNYVSCSPFRVPIARVAAAQAAIED